MIIINCVSIQPLQVSSSSRCTFRCHHSTESVWKGLSQACTSGRCNFTPFSFSKLLRLCQLNSPFQIQQQILHLIEVWALD